MSTDSGRALQRRAQQFRRLLRLTVVLLGAAVAVLTVANAVQGARVSAAELNPQALVARPAEPLTLKISQPVRPVDPEDVRIEPAAPFTVATDQTAVTIRFEEMLDYRTEYEVEVDTVTAATGAGATLAYRFETPDATMYSLVRGAADSTGTSDAIFRRELGDASSAEAVFRAPAIQEYAVAGTVVTAVTLAADGSTELVAAGLDGGPSATILTEPGGVVTDLASSGSSGLIGFTVTSPDHSSRKLFVYDYSKGTNRADEVLGIGGTPLQVQDWVFLPNTTTVVAQTLDMSLYRVDVMSDAAPVPLGQYQEMLGFIPGTTSLAVSDASGAATIDLSSGEETRLTLPSDEAQPGDQPGRVVVLGPQRYAEVLYTPDYSKRPTELNPRVVLVDATGARTIFRPALPDTGIPNLCVSPNGRHLALELRGGDGEPDGYPNVPGFSQTSIVFIDLATGDSSRGANGFLASWC